MPSNPYQRSDEMSHEGPSPEGQYTGMPKRSPTSAPGYPLGPFSPRSVGKPSAEPMPDGQYPHSKQTSASAPPMIGEHTVGHDSEPKPTGQYPHAMSQDASKDSGK